MPQQPDNREDEIASGLLTVTVGGEARFLPELKWRANRAWQQRMQEVFASLLDVPENTPEGQAAMADAQRELVLAYDETGALGDLEDATERELDAVYNRLLEVSFPLAGSREAAALMVIRAVLAAARAAGSQPASSTSGPSPSGATATARTSSRASRSARSSSTTGRRRSGSGARSGPG